MTDVKGMLIAGEWRSGGRSSPNVNPSDTNEIIGHYAQGDADDMRDAIEAACAAQPRWGETTPQARHDILAQAGNEILNRSDELGELLAREEGKTRREAVAETRRAGQIFLYFAGEALRISGEKLASLRPGVEVDVTREPVGVVGIITPWNYPMAIPAWKVAPALCYGNAVVMKPAELVPGSAWMLADILQRAGLPDGVFNLVMGAGSIVGAAMLEDPRIDAISFTGSQATGARVAAACAKHMRRVQLEMGGKNPLVVLDDADIDQAIDCAIDGAFFSTGQRCTASSRLIVTESVHSRFVEGCLERMRGLKVGHALDNDTTIGPVVDQQQLANNLRYIETARGEGGSIRGGGERVECGRPGFYMTPALVTDTSPQMTINREEVFGPVASVMRVRDYEEALYVANDTQFGLCAGICTTSLKYASHFRRSVRAGMVMVNLPTAGVDYHVPFGGTKASSMGPREQGRHAAEFYTVLKTAYVEP
ncbi:aldehyde dehydrogenase family protein [Ahrensia sp. R2A130]|uniref:aldehyde dehydrogenase family protein n=1 Tax=Ahrensia sp. R2A130 TaxID=744979 RepID=UPI0001E0C392|nr:aldehyde dehydrogenase family protein [Ahrensia sp. R2A130]EFL87837.1 aldehyde dehydrogenase, thermostable [Ahrensia sp. R2A130]